MGGVVRAPLFSGLVVRVVPELRSSLTLFEHFVQSASHLLFQSGKPVLDSSVTDKVFVTVRHDFTVLGLKRVGDLGDLAGTGWGNELDGLQTIETISDELAHFGWVGSVRQNSQQGLIGEEIESGEGFLLLFQIFVKRLLASFDGGGLSLEDVVLLGGTSFNHERVDADVNHHFSEFSVQSFEHLGFFGKLSLDIFGGQENVDKHLPVLLHLEPLVDHGVDFSELLSPFLHHVDEEFHVFTLGFHSHKVHGVLIQKFHHVVQRDKHFGSIVLFELELDLGPGLFDILQFLLDLGFFLGNIDKFVHLVFEQVQL